MSADTANPACFVIGARQDVLRRPRFVGGVIPFGGQLGKRGKTIRIFTDAIRKYPPEIIKQNLGGIGCLKHFAAAGTSSVQQRAVQDSVLFRHGCRQICISSKPSGFPPGSSRWAAARLRFLWPGADRIQSRRNAIHWFLHRQAARSLPR